MTYAQLVAAVNALLANGQPITALIHRNAEGVIITEMYNSDSRGAVLALVTQQPSFAGGDELLVVRGGATVRIPYTGILGTSTIIPFGATSGTNTYTVTLSPAITAYTNGMKIHVKVKDASTGASTLNANTVGAKKIFINPTTQAGNGDLVDEQEYIMSYDSALDAAAGGWLIIGFGSTTGGTWGSITGTLSSQTDLQSALDAKAPLASPALTGTPTVPTAATSTNTTQAASTAFVQQEITANSLAFTPADELTEVAGLTLENDITALQLLQALEIPGRVAIHADANEGITLTNQPNSEAAFPLGQTYSYTHMNTVNIRRMRLVVRVHTVSTSANNPRMYIQYSLTAGVSYVTLGAGTVASGDAVSLLATGVHLSNWITLPAESRDDDLRWRVVAHGGDGASDPVIGNVYIEWTT